MAKRKAKAKAKSTGRRTTSRRGPMDAVTLLKNDHREVENWFAQFEKTRSADRKADLAQKICTALTVHTMIEEEIFYPAFFEATEEEDIHHEAIVEHDGAKKLIREIQSAGPDDDYFDARVTVLSEMIKHHVKEEEQRGGMFAKAKEAKMDLARLGEQLAARKKELMSRPEALTGRGSSRSSSRGGSRRGSPAEQLEDGSERTGPAG